MADAVIRFEREGLEGLVAVGTYLSDALKRFGIRLDEPCDPLAGEHACSVTVTSGIDLLSKETDREREHFAEAGRRANERLACETKIVKPGEIAIMTDEKKNQTSETDEKAKMVDDFTNLPLEQKIANLVKMEVVTLGETLSFVVNSPFTVLEKVGDVMAEFGMKLEREAKKAARPVEAEPEKGYTPPKPKPGPAKGKSGGRTPKPPAI